MQARTVIEEIRRKRTVTGPDGQTYPIQNCPIDAAEGRFLSEFIASRPDIVRTLEVGCAYGVSSLHIASALAVRPGAHHLIIDPFQSTTWSGIGVANLERAGANFYELREEYSEIALPQLLKEGAEFDLAFIDGWHTFDQTIVDMYYTTRLVKLGGYIIIDDADWAGVAKAISYFAKYPCYKIVGGASAPVLRLAHLVAKVFKPVAEALFPRWLYDRCYAVVKYPTMVALQKVAEDERSATWFRPF